MSREYHKIQTLWHRDPETNHKTLVEDMWSEPEFEMLASAAIWDATEKIDGTNIRIMWDGKGYKVAGKTHRAQIPAHLLEAIQHQITTQALKITLGTRGGLVLYGEGCGEKIQKAGAMYGEPHFVLFDIAWISDDGDNQVWFERATVEGVAESLNIPVVPVVVRRATLARIVEFVKILPASQHGNGIMEGVVMRPYMELRTRMGKRIISKVKVKDFIKA